MISKKFILSAIMLIFLCSISLSAVMAADSQNIQLNDSVNVKTFSDLQTKVDNTHSDDTLYLNGENFNQTLGEKTIQINKNIKINGASKDNPSLVTTINCDGNSNAFVISDGITASFMNIHFINGKSGYGGAISAGSDCNVNLDNCTFIDNTANKQGGAVHVNYRSNLSINNCIFSDNFADDKGGAINGATNSKIAISNSNFKNNSAGWGGAICGYSSSSITISNSTFTNNSATYFKGGAIYAHENSFLNVSNSNFTGNKVFSFNGGAIYGDTNTNMIISNSIFKNNSAFGRDDCGGAIYGRSGSKLNVTNSTFVNNFASNKGGAINEDINAIVSISNSTFINNTAINGGALYVWGPTTVSNSIFTNNIAKEGSGAAIYEASKSTLNVDNSVFTNNSSTSYGGAIYGDLESSTFISNSAFTKNIVHTGMGGAIYNSIDAIVNVSNSEFTDNTAYRDGGAIYSSIDAIVAVSNSTFVGNIARNGKGGAIGDYSETVDVFNSTFINNQANKGCAIYHADDSYNSNTKCDVSILNCTFNNDVEVNEIGVICISGYSVNCILSKNVINSNIIPINVINKARIISPTYLTFENNTSKSGEMVVLSAILKDDNNNTIGFTQCNITGIIENAENFSYNQTTHTFQSKPITKDMGEYVISGVAPSYVTNCTIINGTLIKI